MSTFEQRRERLRAWYGFDFPDDFFAFWDFARRLRPLEPLRALEEPLGLALVGPFEVLAGRFDDLTPRYSPLLHWRYHDDPPEFFTVLAGGGDGGHHGYFLDDPGLHPGCVAHYYARDVYELWVAGDTLFEAARLDLEYHYRDGLVEGRDRAEIGQLDRFREQLMRVATGERRETGDTYTERYAGLSARNDRVTAETWEGMGIVVPEGTYRPLSLSERQLKRALRKRGELEGVVEEARQALRDGYPGTALKLGKDLWPLTGRTRARYAGELLEGAYQALEREVLRQVLRTHRAQRDLPSVDILEMEFGEDEGP